MRLELLRPRNWFALIAACGIGIVAILCVVARADVIVLANRTKAPIPFRFVPKSGAAQQLTLPAGDTLPLFLDGKADITFSPNGGQKHYSLDANCAYYFGQNSKGPVDLQKIGLGDDGTAVDGRKLPGAASRTPTVTI